MYQRLRDGHPVVAATCCAVLQFLVTLAILLAGKALLPHEQFGKVKLVAFASTLLFPIVLAQFLGLWRHVGLGRPKAWLFTFAALLACVPFLTAGLRVPPDTTIAGAITIQAINAVAEELLFRGIIFALLIRLPVGRALLINGLLFGAMHLLHGVMDGDWAAAGYQALMTIFGGLLFAAVRAETGSLLASDPRPHAPEPQRDLLEQRSDPGSRHARYRGSHLARDTVPALRLGGS